MRIPVYEQQRGVSAPQVRTTQVAPPLDLGQAIGIIENKYEQGVKEQEQGRKIFAANEMSRVDLELSKKYAEIQERIASGGDYASADKEFNKFFDQTTKESVQRLGPTDIIAAGAQTDYQRAGVEYGLKLKSAIRSRAKSDASDNLNLSLATLEIELSNAKSEAERLAITGKMTSKIAKGASLGLYSAADGKLKIMKIADKSATDFAKADPDGFINDVQTNPDKYKGVPYIDEKITAAKKWRVQKQQEADAMEQFSGLISDKEMLEKYNSGVSTFADLTADASQADKNILSAINKTANGEKLTDEDKRLGMASLDDLLLDVVNTKFNENGSFNFTADNVKAVREYAQKVYALSPMLNKTELENYLTPVTELQAAVDNNNAGEDGILNILPGINNPYGHALKSMDKYFTKDLGISEKSIKARETKRLMLDDFSSAYTQAQEEAKKTGASVNPDKVVKEVIETYRSGNKPVTPPEPEIGFTQDGFKYMGGGANDPNNWKKL